MKWAPLPSCARTRTRQPPSCSRSIPTSPFSRAMRSRSCPCCPYREPSAAPARYWVCSADRLLEERDDSRLLGGGQLLQREDSRPHAAVVELCLVAEAEGRVPRLELLGVLEVADHISVLGIRGHPVPGSRRQPRCGGFDERMQPLREAAIRLRKCGNLRQYGGFIVRLVALALRGIFLHRGPLLVRESPRLPCRGGAL